MLVLSYGIKANLSLICHSASPPPLRVLSLFLSTRALSPSLCFSHLSNSISLCRFVSPRPLISYIHSLSLSLPASHFPVRSQSLSLFVSLSEDLVVSHSLSLYVSPSLHPSLNCTLAHVSTHQRSLSICPPLSTLISIPLPPPSPCCFSVSLTLLQPLKPSYVRNILCAKTFGLCLPSYSLALDRATPDQDTKDFPAFMLNGGFLLLQVRI